MGWTRLHESGILGRSGCKRGGEGGDFRPKERRVYTWGAMWGGFSVNASGRQREMPDQVGHDGGEQVGHGGDGVGRVVSAYRAADTNLTFSCMFLLPRRGTCCFYKILIIFVSNDLKLP